MRLGFSGSGHSETQPIMRDLEREVLEEAGRWPNAQVPTIVALVGRFIAGHRDQEAYLYFQERAKSRPEQPLFLALEGFFQARRGSIRIGENSIRSRGRERP